MKRIFAIVLAGIMMLSLAACGGTGSSTRNACFRRACRQHAVRQGDHGRFHLG